MADNPQRRTILVVDDNAAVRGLAKRALGDCRLHRNHGRRWRRRDSVVMNNIGHVLCFCSPTS